MRKMLTALALTAATALALTGCTPASTTPEHPAAGFWVTAAADGKAVGDVWCLRASSYSANTFDCQWATFTDPGTHANARQADGEYHYVLAADGSEHKVFCINYVMRKGYRVINCNWNGVPTP